MTTYRIVRLFQGDYPRERLQGGLTLAEAQAHCTDPETSSRTCTNAEGKRLTKRRGPWFDAYEEEPERTWAVRPNKRSPSMPKYRTITLTDRAPIKIDEEAWPVVARGRQSWHDNQYEFQANRKVDVQILVRQHQDGRAVVYGYVDFDSNYQNERSYVERAGVIVACGDDLASAIRDVASSLADQAGDEAERIGVAKRDCIAALPAEVLS